MQFRRSAIGRLGRRHLGTKRPTQRIVMRRGRGKMIHAKIQGLKAHRSFSLQHQFKIRAATSPRNSPRPLRAVPRPVKRARSVSPLRRPQRSTNQRFTGQHQTGTSSMHNTQSLFPQRVIVACDENYKYIQFWETIAKHWREVHNITPTLFFIGSPTSAVNDKCGDVVRIMPPPGIPTSFVAQIIRLVAPSMFPEEVCVIADIDLFLLDKNFFARYCTGIPRDHFLSLNRYQPYVKRISMCYQIALGRLFGELFHCDGTVTGMMRLVQNWSGMASDWGADEKHLNSTLHSWHGRTGRWHCIYTPGLWGDYGAQKTISRYWKNSAYNEQLLRQGNYIEFEPPRSFAENLPLIRHVLTTHPGGFQLPQTTPTYQGRNTGPSRHPGDKKFGGRRRIGHRTVAVNRVHNRPQRTTQLRQRIKKS